MSAIIPVYSTAKVFTAAAVLRSFDIDATIGDLVPGLPEDLRSLTLRSLLSHRSGLCDYGGWADYREAVAAREDAWPAANVLERATVSEAGSFRYSNIGYLLLRMAVERRIGTGFFTAIDRLVLSPLGVDAFPFESREDWVFCTCESITDNLRAYDPGWVYPGTFAADPADVARGLAAIMRGELGPDLPRLMKQTIGVDIPESDPMAPDAGYGLGLMTKGQPVLAVGHGGGGPGFNLFIASNPDGTRWYGAARPTEEEDPDLIRSCIAHVL